MFFLFLYDLIIKIELSRTKWKVVKRILSIYNVCDRSGIFHGSEIYSFNLLQNVHVRISFYRNRKPFCVNHRHMGHGFRFLLPPFLYYPPFSKCSYKSFLFQNFHNHSFFLHLTISVDVIHHE